MIKRTFMVISLLTIAPTAFAVPPVPTTVDAESVKEYFKNLRPPDFFDFETCANAALVYVGFKGLEKAWGWLTRPSGLVFPDDIPAAVANNTEKITTAQTALKKVDDAVNVNAENITTLASVLQGAKSKNDGIVHRVDLLERRVDALEAREKELGTTLDGYTTAIGNIGERLGKMQKNIVSIDARHAQEDAARTRARVVSMSSNPAVTRSTARTAVTEKIEQFNQGSGNQ